MKTTTSLFLSLLLTVGLAACSGGGDEEAPAEAPVEDATAALKDSVEEVGESAGEAIEDAGEVMADAQDLVAAKISDLGAEISKLAGQEVSVGCGSCIYEMDGVKGCELAAKVGDKPYLVTGVDFDTHGSGLCTSESTAKITGTVNEKGISATSVELTD